MIFLSLPLCLITQRPIKNTVNQRTHSVPDATMKTTDSPARPAAAGIPMDSTEGRCYHRSHGPGLRLKHSEYSKAFPPSRLERFADCSPLSKSQENKYQKQLENPLQKILKNNRKGWVSLK